MPMLWDGLDEQTFNKFTKNLLKHLQHSPESAATLGALREAATQALGHASVRAARQTWTAPRRPSRPPEEVPGRPWAVMDESGVVERLRAPQRARYVERPPMPEAWREALEAVAVGPQAVVDWAEAHPDAVGRMRWYPQTPLPEQGPDHLISFPEALLREQGAAGVNAYIALMDAAEQHPEWAVAPHLADSAPMASTAPGTETLRAWQVRHLVEEDVERLVRRMREELVGAFHARRSDAHNPWTADAVRDQPLYQHLTTVAHRFPQSERLARPLPLAWIVALEQWPDLDRVETVLRQQQGRDDSKLYEWAVEDLIAQGRTDLIDRLVPALYDPRDARATDTYSNACGHPQSEVRAWAIDRCLERMAHANPDVARAMRLDLPGMLRSLALCGDIGQWMRMCAALGALSQEHRSEALPAYHIGDVLGAIGYGAWTSDADRSACTDAFLTAVPDLLKTAKLSAQDVASLGLLHTIDRFVMRRTPDPTTDQGQHILGGVRHWLGRGARWEDPVTDLLRRDRPATQPGAALLERTGFSLAWTDAALALGLNLAVLHHAPDHRARHSHLVGGDVEQVSPLLQGILMECVTDPRPWVERGAVPLAQEEAAARWLGDALWTDTDAWLDTRARPERLTGSDPLLPLVADPLLAVKPWPTAGSVRRGTAHVRAVLERWGVAPDAPLVAATWGRVLYPEQAALLHSLTGTLPTVAQIAGWMAAHNVVRGMFGPAINLTAQDLAQDPGRVHAPRVERVHRLLSWALAAGADATGAVDDQGNTLLYWAAALDTQPDASFQALLSALIGAGLDPLATNAHGQRIDQMERSSGRNAMALGTYLTQFVAAQAVRAAGAPPRPR